MTEFDYYIQQGEPSQHEKAEAWAIAIGLQDVDELKPSQYLVETARKHIEGEVDYAEAQRLVNSYYETLPASEQNTDTEEADKVALHITQVLSEHTFAFSPAELANIHRRLFTGVLPHAGKYRDVNITKKEWVLNGDTVLYASCDSISATLAYDFGQEKQFSYARLSKDDMIAHFSKFVSGIWQIHPFREGNTRTTAVFAIKYLRKLGYRVTYEPFADNAKYFRNALVRANYQNYEKSIGETTEFLELFFRNVLLGEQHPLKKRYQHIDWKQAQPTPEKPIKMTNIAVVLAGGIGSRVGGGMPKQLLPLEDGRSILEHSVETFEQAACIDEIGIVMHPDYIACVEEMLLRNGWQKVAFVIAGGKERWESSVNAIREIERRAKDKEQRIGTPILQPTSNKPITNILLHDAARPFVSARIIEDVCKALETHEAVTVAIPATDTMYSVSETATGKIVQAIPPRATLMCAQTPQAFRLETIAAAYRQAMQAPHLQATDDCGIVRAYLPDIPIHIVQGDPANRKITYKEDL